MTNNLMKVENRSVLTRVLFAAYASVLAEVILFKFPFSHQEIGGERIVNLIPVAGSFTEDGGLRFGEIADNILAFVPLGIYLCMMKRTWSFRRKTLAIACTSMAFEITQFMFAIGRADITDVLGNTLGGIVGIGAYASLTKVLRHRSRIDRVVNIAALILTACALVLFAFLSTRTRTLYR